MFSVEGSAGKQCFQGKEAVFSVEGSVFNGRKQCFQFREAVF